MSQWFAEITITFVSTSENKDLTPCIHQVWVSTAHLSSLDEGALHGAIFCFPGQAGFSLPNLYAVVQSVTFSAGWWKYYQSWLWRGCCSSIFCWFPVVWMNLICLWIISELNEGIYSFWSFSTVHKYLLVKFKQCWYAVLTLPASFNCNRWALFFLWDSLPYMRCAGLLCWTLVSGRLLVIQCLHFVHACSLWINCCEEQAANFDRAATSACG